MARNDKCAFLHASAEDGVWLRACGLIKSVDKACNRLDDESDAEALHDFRVAVRQLRTFIREYRDYLPINKKYRRALRDLARNTSDVRDLEVLVELLQSEKKLPALSCNIAIDLLLETLNAKLAKLYKPLRLLEVRRWKSLRKSLVRHIKAVRQKTNCGYSFLDVTRNRISELTDTLEQELSGLYSSHDDHLSHNARITGKQLRYLIEPLQREKDRAVGIVAELKIVQDALGDYHDAFVLLQHIESSIYDIYGQYAQQKVRQTIEGEGKPSSRDPMADCLLLVQAVTAQRAHLWERFYRHYVVDRNTLFIKIQTLTAELGNPPPVESSEDTTVLDMNLYRKKP